MPESLSLVPQGKGVWTFPLFRLPFLDFVPYEAPIGENWTVACVSSASIHPREPVMQASAQSDLTENKAWKGAWSDRILETVRILRVERGDYRKVCFFMLSWLIFKCNVDGGIPSLAAAPFDPATFPLLAARAVSMICFS